MNAEEAADFVNRMQPEVAIPTHYGSVVGGPEDAEVFKSLVKEPISVCVKIGAEAATAAQEETCRKWNLLDKALGGPGGANFRLYAQGRNLRNLLEAGSGHLATMSGGRYRFEWNPVAGTLEPLVRDRHFEAPRPVSNLSGGESFLASLALALAFSRFGADERDAVGTLFLDEGFGTLDEAALDKALDVLAGLRGENRQVGLVTHVAQVKERVPVRIDVTKLGDGRSALSGAGVSRGGTESAP